MPDGKLIALCTCPDEDTAVRIARLLVTEKAAACVNIIGGIRSIYAWQGAVADDAETLILIKTSTGRFARLKQLVSEHHPYDTPELVAIPIVAGAEKYLEWLAESLA